MSLKHPAPRELVELLRFLSYKGNSSGKLAAAEYCVGLLEEVGFKTLLVGNPEAPTIIARIDGNGPGRLLFYNHYDVLPAGNDADWRTDAFTPVMKDGLLYARGSSDHKASFTARLEAVRALVHRGALPVGITFLIDGEEEIGSPSLEKVIIENRDLLEAEGGLYSGGARAENGGMVIRAGCKGRCEIELSVTYGDRDNHSKWAAILPNPGWRLIMALASLHEALVEDAPQAGYRSGATGPDAHDLEAMAMLPFEPDAFLAGVGHQALRHDVKEDPLQSLMFSPTFNLAYLKSGTGSGTVLPGSATAKLDIRLVPGQHPDAMAAIVRSHLEKRGFDDVAVAYEGGSEPDKCNLDDPVVSALNKAASTFPGPVVIHPMGAGSGPRYLFRRHLNYSLVQDPGCSWAGSNDHGPNENIKLQHYFENCTLIEGFLLEYGKLRSTGHGSAEMGERRDG